MLNCFKIDSFFLSDYRVCFVKYKPMKLGFLGVDVRVYCVIQSDGNSFCGDVVLDSFNKAPRDEDNIFDQIYKSKYVRNIITMNLILLTI